MKRVVLGVFCMVIVIVTCALSLELRLLRRIEFSNDSDKYFAEIAVNVFGDIYLIEANYDELYMIGENGEIEKRVGGSGWDDENLDRPMDLVVADDVNVLVADYNNHKIKRYDRNLNYIGKFPESAPDEYFLFPVSVAYERGGFFCVLDGERNEVILFNPELSQRFVFGGREYGLFSLEDPLKVRVDGDRNVYVLEGNGEVKVFKFSGKPSRVIKGAKGKAEDIEILGSSIILVLCKGGVLSVLGDGEREELFLGGAVGDSSVVAFAICGSKIYFLNPAGRISVCEIVK